MIAYLSELPDRHDGRPTCVSGIQDWDSTCKRMRAVATDCPRCARASCRNPVAHAGLGVALVDRVRFAHLLGISLVLAGCVADPATESDEQAATTAFANDRAAFDFFINKGLSAVQAAGIV